MSYNLTVTATRSDIVDAIGRVVREADLPQLAEQEAREHLAACAAGAVGQASVTGRHTDEVTVTISGHANPGHAPAEGWANEMTQVTVSVTNVEPPLEVAEKAGDGSAA